MLNIFKSISGEIKDPSCDICVHRDYCTELCEPVASWLISNGFWKESFSFSELTFSHDKLEFIINSALKSNKIYIEEETDLFSVKFPSNYRLRVIQVMTSSTFFSQRQKVCIWLYYYNNIRKIDIARFLGVTSNCVTVYLRKGIEKLKRYVFQEDVVRFDENLSNSSNIIIKCARQTCSTTWEFDVVRPTKKFCSRKCYRAIHSRKRRKKKPRQGVMVMCTRPGCTTTFLNRYGKKYCSPYCRMYKYNIDNGWKAPKKLKDSLKRNAIGNIYD